MSETKTELVSTQQAPIEDGTSTALIALPARELEESNLDYVQRLMEMLPPPAADVIDAIAGKILAAGSMYEENLLWEGTSSKDALDRRFIVHSVSVQPSDFEDSPLDYYVVAHVTDLDAGERTVFTSGSINIAVALVKAQLLGQLPWECEIKGPKRTPKNGRIPLHIRWVAKIVDAGVEEE